MSPAKPHSPGHLVLDDTSNRFKQITAEQISRGYGFSRSGTRNLLSAFTGEGLLGSIQVLAPKELPPCEAPLFAWNTATDEAPDFGALSYRAIQRWSREVVLQTVYYATPRTAKLFGGHSGRPRNLMHGFHELQLTETYLAYRARWPELAEWWFDGEALFPRHRRYRVRVPDAIIYSSKDGQTLRAIEVVGSYPPNRIRSLHNACVSRRLPYELW
jgi:hypothetical protein